MTLPFRYSFRPNCRGREMEGQGEESKWVTWISTSGAMSGMKRESKILELKHSRGETAEEEEEGEDRRLTLRPPP
jgi:hypothetical protein